jgi:hypothetical protein
MAAATAAAVLCGFDGCEREAIASCECCNAGTPFCDEHGSPGVDRHDRDGYYTAWPDACFACGGYNADA